MEIGMRTKASGFDVVFMSCVEVTGSILITDDKGMDKKINCGHRLTQINTDDKNQQTRLNKNKSA